MLVHHNPVKKTVLGLLSLLFLIAALFFLRNVFIKAATVESLTLDTNAISSVSIMDQNEQNVRFFVSADEGVLYKSTQEDLGAVLDFINKEPQVEDGNVKGLFSGTSRKSLKRKIIPKAFANNSYLQRLSRDSRDNFMKNRGFKLQKDHYYFRQSIQGKKVFGAGLNVHVRNKKEIYAASGNLLLNENLAPARFTPTQAADIAVRAASEEEGATPDLYAVTNTAVVFNQSILGIGTDKVNYPAQEIVVGTRTTPVTFAMKYIVSLTDGKILYSEPLIAEALNRHILNCTGGVSQCPLARGEGSSTTGNRDVDTAYTSMGDIYNFFKNTFQRDSYDNQGAPLDAYVNVTTQVSCPNALWTKAPYNQFVFCQGMAVNDIIAHEYTHAVTEHTAALMSLKQSGALDEGISDVFAFAIDNDWSLGEDSVIGTIRNADDPNRDPTSVGGPHPDRLFSPNYECSDRDRGGIHVNMTIVDKAFYLMSVGGSFNGCSMTGIGKSNAHAIWYRALTTYLDTSANFKFAYTSLLQSCGDLYGSSSSTCDQVRKSLQAVEMDQQPVGEQQGPLCLNVARTTPACALAVSPTSQQVTPTRIVTQVPTGTGCSKKSKGDADCNDVIDLIDFEIWRKEATGTLTTKNADFFADGLVNVVDFEVWRKGFFGQI